MNGKKPLLIAIAGKGGVGKTTTSALIVRGLLRAGMKPVLAVDADPNANLHSLLGFGKPRDLGGLRDEMKAKHGGTVPQAELLEGILHERLVEGGDVDMISMGHIEGPGCYCYINDLLRRSMDRLGGNYGAIVVDNEAGMEHLSRRNLRAVDHLVLVADPSPRGMAAAATIRDLVPNLGVTVGTLWLLVNRPYHAGTASAVALDGTTLLADVPNDPSLPAWEESNRAVVDIGDDSKAATAVAQAVAKHILSRATET